MFGFEVSSKSTCSLGFINFAISFGDAGLVAKAQDEWVSHQEDEEKEVNHHGVVSHCKEIRNTGEKESSVATRITLYSILFRVIKKRQRTGSKCIFMN